MNWVATYYHIHYSLFKSSKHHYKLHLHMIKNVLVHVRKMHMTIFVLSSSGNIVAMFTWWFPSSNKFIWDMALIFISKSDNSSSKSHSLVGPDLYSSFLCDKMRRLECIYTSSSTFLEPNLFLLTEWMKSYVL